MKYLIWSLVAALIILHQDFWNWDNANLIFGFLPVTLFYQICISLGAGLTWFLAVQFAWPAELEYIEQQLEEKEGED
ncbi:hypothetical protein LOC68_22750 [Blastopirellula sp. JC732]|uniref:DUF3311 domain-containing protein n=1 Tax=Blastopirellula sediminis TaxID=2894196 RepID=A0A9X1MSE7_9BACT|nr:hypothetical protein [Blastopirellula sediminis]MCC9605478.1 hypothetical protein [Blastopirellula sediminis]MCC9631222.1 hypothetical protein [Blastopirellula sediminis]